MSESNRNHEIPKMAALRIQSFENIAGRVWLFKYVKKRQFDVTWKYTEQIERKKMENSKLKMIWAFKGKEENKEVFLGGKNSVK